MKQPLYLKTSDQINLKTYRCIVIGTPIAEIPLYFQMYPERAPTKTEEDRTEVDISIATMVQYYTDKIRFTLTEGHAEISQVLQNYINRYKGMRIGDIDIMERALLERMDVFLRVLESQSWTILDRAVSKYDSRRRVNPLAKLERLQ